MKIVAAADLTTIEDEIVAYLSIIGHWKDGIKECLLLKALGVDLNIKNANGLSALMLATSALAWDTVKLLLAEGAVNLDDKDKFGYSLLMLIALKSAEDPSLIPLLLDLGL